MRLACLLLVLVMVTSVAGASETTQRPTRAQLLAKTKRQAVVITRLRSQLADTRLALADARSERDAQAEQVKQLQARDPLDAVLARDADGKWTAMLALWRAFPALTPGGCGYDKATSELGSLGLVATTYTFYLWSGC